MCGGEEDDAENVEMSSEVPTTRTDVSRQGVDEQTAATGRTRKPNPNNREEVEAEEIHRLRRSLSGYLSRVSSCISQLKTYLSEWGEVEGIRESVKNIERAWARYNDHYQNYVCKELSVREFGRVESNYVKVYEDHSRYVKEAEERLSPLAYCMSNKSSKSRVEPKLSPITSTGSSISRSSKSSRLKELKRSVELKRLKARQALELSNYEA